MNKKKQQEETPLTITLQEQPQPVSHLPQVGNTPDMLIALGIEKGLSIDQLERLMDMQEKWLARIAKSQYLEAKKNFQFEVPRLQKSKKVGYETKGETGGRVDYNYAPLGDIAEQLKPALHKNGLSYDWKLEDIVDEKGTPKIKGTCIISHVGGHSEATTMEAYHDASGKKNPIQSRGSTITYIQRYTLIAALGITTADTDNDGRNTLSGPPKEAAKTSDNIAKPVITEEAFKKALIRISKGEKIEDQLNEHYQLNEEQKNAITALSKNAPTQTAKPTTKKAASKGAQKNAVQRPDSKEETNTGTPG